MMVETMFVVAGMSPIAGFGVSIYENKGVGKVLRIPLHEPPLT